MGYLTKVLPKKVVIKLKVSETLAKEFDSYKTELENRGFKLDEEFILKRVVAVLRKEIGEVKDK